MENELIYIATPYMATEGFVDAIKFERTKNVTKFAAQLMSRGVHVYSPITHCHQLAMAQNLPGDWDFWHSFDEKMIPLFTMVIVYQQPGWKESIGVTNEINAAQRQGTPILFIAPEMPIDNVVEAIKSLVKALEVQRAQG